VPISGGGDPARAHLLSHIRIWAFHCQDDPIVPANGSRDMFTALVRSRNVSHDRVRVQRVAQGTEREADEMSIRPVEGEPWAEVRYTEYTGRAANAPKHNAWARAMSDVRLLRWLLPPKGRSVMAAPKAQGGGRAARDAHGPRRWADGASIKRGRCSPRPMLGR